MERDRLEKLKDCLLKIVYPQTKKLKFYYPEKNWKGRVEYFGAGQGHYSEGMMTYQKANLKIKRKLSEFSGLNWKTYESKFEWVKTDLKHRKRSSPAESQMREPIFTDCIYDVVAPYMDAWIETIIVNEVKSGKQCRTLFRRYSIISVF